MIDEYLEPDLFESRPLRYVPIRSRSEFLPSVLYGDLVETTAGALSAPAVRGQPTPSKRKSIAVIRPLRAPLPPLTAPVERPPRDGVLRFTRRVAERMGISLLEHPAPDEPTPFRVNGFLIGCAMGSLAAALVLLVVRVAIGLLA
jgi:hypothetical protein